MILKVVIYYSFKFSSESRFSILNFPLISSPTALSASDGLIQKTASNTQYSKVLSATLWTNNLRLEQNQHRSGTSKNLIRVTRLCDLSRKLRLLIIVCDRVQVATRTAQCCDFGNQKGAIVAIFRDFSKFADFVAKIGEIWDFFGCDNSSLVSKVIFDIFDHIFF